MINVLTTGLSDKKKTAQVFMLSGTRLVSFDVSKAKPLLSDVTFKQFSCTQFDAVY